MSSWNPGNLTVLHTSTLSPVFQAGLKKGSRQIRQLSQALVERLHLMELHQRGSYPMPPGTGYAVRNGDTFWQSGNLS